MRLTNTSVEKLAASTKPTFHYDSDLKGFGVCVFPPSKRAPTGTKSWIVEYRPGAGGRGTVKRRLTIGAVGVLNATDARGKAKDILARVELGENPADDRAEDRRSATLADLVKSYQQEAGAGRKPSTKALYDSYWRLWILPELGTMKAKDVKRTDIARLHRKVGAQHETTANRLVTLLAHFYRWAGSTGAVPEGFNPAKDVERFREAARERYLSTEELQRLGAAIREAETVGIPWEQDPDKPVSKHAPKPENRRTRITPHAAAAIRLLLLTGARLREILHLRWSEVDLERGLLLLPDSKTGRKTIVLGGAALTVIADLDKVGGFVIAGQGPRSPKAKGAEKEPDQPRWDLQRPWALVCRHAGLKGVRLHDLRHTFASYGAAGGLGLPVIGGLLGHADSKTTQRYAHLGSDPLRRASNLISGEISAAMARGVAKEQANG